MIRDIAAFSSRGNRFAMKTAACTSWASLVESILLVGAEAEAAAISCVW